MRVNFRQGIVQHQTNFLTVGSATTVNLIAADHPTVVTIAHRDTDYIFTEFNSAIPAWVNTDGFDSGTRYWLYWDFNLLTFERTFGFTTLEPIEQSVDPATAGSPNITPQVGQHWYNTATNRHFVWQGTQWQEVLRVFAAELRNGNTFISQSLNAPSFIGTQIGNTSSVLAGRVLFGESGKTIKRDNGTFFTTEDQFFASASRVDAIRLESNVARAQLTGTSAAAAFSVVAWVDDGKVRPAVYNDIGSTVVGILTEDVVTSQSSPVEVNGVGGIIIQGVVTNPDWNWTVDVGSPLWIKNGELTPVDPHKENVVTYPTPQVPVARVLSSDTVVFEQGLGGTGLSSSGSVSLPAATTSSLGAVTLTVPPPGSPAEPALVPSDNDPRLSDTRDPTPHLHDATEITFTPGDGISASDVDGALRELSLSGGGGGGGSWGSITGTLSDQTDLQNALDAKVDKAGDTMTGTLTLAADPVNPLEAATKQYVDATAGGGAATFTGLSDTPANYTGAANQFLAVNGAENAVEFVSAAGATLSAEEQEFWQIQAALLDPAAYVYKGGTGWSATVPVGETWAILNLWNVQVNGSSTSYHRSAASRKAIFVGEGTTLSDNGNVGSTLYFCRPSLVIGNPEYNNPKTLYFQRLSTIRSLTIDSLQVDAAGGLGNRISSDFPADFGDGIMVEAMNFDVSWISLRNNTVTQSGINTQDEISDDSAHRFTETIMTPWPRPVLPTMEVRPGSEIGSGGSALPGNGILLYSKLPDGFRSTPIREREQSYLADSPRRFYTMSEIAGTVGSPLTLAVDRGTDGIDAAYEGDITFGRLVETFDGSTSTQFLANQSRVRVAPDPFFDFGGSDFTIEFFVFFSDLGISGFEPWIYNYWQTDTNVTNSILLAHNHDVGSFRMRVKTVSTTDIDIDSTVPVSTGNWYHVITGRDGGNLFMRVVGQEARQTVPIGEDINARNGDLHLAAGWNSNGNSFQFGLNGALHNFAIYDFALSDARADAHAAARIGTG